MSATKNAERILGTPRLMLEPLRPSHAALLFEGLSDPRLYVYHAGRPQSAESLMLRFTQLATRRSPDGSETWLNWALRLKDGTYVGWVQATIVSETAIVGYDIFAEHWRNGYAREACVAMLGFLKKNCGVELARAIVDVENTASIKLLESLGFQRVWTGASEDMPGRLDHQYETSMVDQ